MKNIDKHLERLSERSRKIYDFICTYCEQHNGLAPSTREIQQACQISSTSVVKYHIDLLINTGLLQRQENVARSIYVVGSRWVGPRRSVPISDPLQ